MPGQVAPDPLDKHTQAKTGLTQEFQVHSGPDKPGGVAAEPNPVAFEDCEIFPNHGQVAFVEIAEGGRQGFSGDLAVNKVGRIAALLDRYLGTPGSGLPS